MMIGIVYAILSAITWGAGDFFGGLSTRRSSQFRALVQVSIIGAVLMFLAFLILKEPWPSPIDIFWAASAGLGGAFGILALYYGLSQGNAALVSPVAAVLSAALPLLVSILAEGFPPPLKLAGLVIAVPGIWQVTRSSSSIHGIDRRALWLAILAGVGFAGFFILIAQVQEGHLFGPLIVSKLAALIIGLVFLANRRERLSGLALHPAVLFAGLFDVGGNVFFLLAEQHTRLDIASVLSSMYAAVTVLLSERFLKEEVSASQWFGVGLCLTAVALIVA